MDIDQVVLELTNDRGFYTVMTNRLENYFKGIAIGKSGNITDAAGIRAGIIAKVRPITGFSTSNYTSNQRTMLVEKIKDHYWLECRPAEEVPPVPYSHVNAIADMVYWQWDLSVPAILEDTNLTVEEKQRRIRSLVLGADSKKRVANMGMMHVLSNSSQTTAVVNQVLHLGGIDMDEYGTPVSAAGGSRVSNNVNVKKEKPMSGIKLETKIFLNGRDASDFSDAEIFSAIAQVEGEIERLEKIKHKPEKLKKAIAKLESDIDDAVKYVDARDKKGNVKTEEAE